MDVNVTYHWTYLGYAEPYFKEDATWGPVALINIDAKVELPFARDGFVMINYDKLRCEIDGDGGDPRGQILEFIQHYAEVKGIDIQCDFLEKWEEKKLCPPGEVAPWDEEF